MPQMEFEAYMLSLAFYTRAQAITEKFVDVGFFEHLEVFF